MCRLEWQNYRLNRQNSRLNRQNYRINGGQPVKGTASSLDSATKAELAELGVASTYVVGGTGVVSGNLQKALPGAKRLSGADRYATNLAVAKEFYPSAKNIYVATGVNFPDALVGGPLAGTNPGPLLLVKQGAWPKASLTYVKGVGFEHGHLLGGTGVLADVLKNLNTSF